LTDGLKLHCASCRVRLCLEAEAPRAYPSACPTDERSGAVERTREEYRDPGRLRLFQAAARVEARGYLEWPRVREIVEFAKLNGFRRLGIAFCVGLQREAAAAAEIFASHGFEVYPVVCKVGRIPKEEFDLEEEDKVHPGRPEISCNPIGQAAVLEDCGTELNVVVGLCVGHDTVFFQRSAAPVTVLVAKDRVTGHNPAAALYGARGYFRSRVFGEERGDPSPRAKKANEGEES